MSIQRIIWCVAICAVVGLTHAARADICMQDVCVRFEPSHFDATMGYDFTINVVADINHAVVGWGLDVSTVTGGVVTQNANPSIGAAWIAVNSPDGDKLAGLAFPDGVSGTDILLATLHFHPVGNGQTDLLLSITQGDQTEGFALDPTGFGTTSFSPGSIFVPEPVSGLLCAAAFLIASRRRNGR